MKRSLIKLGFVAFILILLIPSRIEIVAVTDFYNAHRFLTGLLIVLLLAGIGYSLRSYSEMKLNRSKEI